MLELSWYGTREVTLPLGQGFHQRRLTLRSSQVGSVAAAQRARWDHRRRMALALSLLDGPGARSADHRRGRLRPTCPRSRPAWPGDPGDTLMHRIRYG